jgi:hypothetical protein
VDSAEGGKAEMNQPPGGIDKLSVPGDIEKTK